MSTREARIICILEETASFARRLGTVHLVDIQPDQAMIVTEEILGQPLDVPLHSEYRRQPGTRCLAALFLAGKWLSGFQQISYGEEDSILIGKHSPHDLVEYCGIRLRKLQSLQYRWVTDERREHVMEAVATLRSQADNLEQERVWCHGDYTPGNMIWDGRTLTPIDFTTANLGVPLLDVTYFIHRLEMQRTYFPWKYWPLEVWRRAFLRGYGRPDAEQSPMYRALMIRHLLCRLLTYIRRPPKNMKQRLHNKWVRFCVRRELLSRTDTVVN